MSIRVRAGIVVAALTAALSIAGPATAAGTSAHTTTQRDLAAALPPYDTWIADVTAVTDKAKSYLRTRLPDASVKPAIVLDIDNTSLQTAYRPGVTSPATPAVLETAKLAESLGADVFFVSDRREILKALTTYNLRSEGYPLDGLYLRSNFDFEPVQDLKTKSRAAIEKRGYTIVANIGNLETDLAGGHAERTFKLPDYDGALG